MRLGECTYQKNPVHFPYASLRAYRAFGDDVLYFSKIRPNYKKAESRTNLQFMLDSSL